MASLAGAVSKGSIKPTKVQIARLAEAVLSQAPYKRNW